MEQLATALGENYSLTSLSLEWNAIGPVGGKTLAGVLPMHGTLRALNLGWNGLGDQGIAVLADALSYVQQRHAPHTIVDSGFGPPSSSTFRQTFDAFAPALGGAPIGNAVDGLDDDRLNGTNNDTRAQEITAALEDLARFVAVVTAHECGHSMGLVQNGAMPTGLYGNDTTNFPGSSDGHIRNTALFPSGSTNVMSPSLSYSAAINAATAFNSLNLAYLREQVYYGN
jgi:hypothetical protein